MIVWVSLLTSYEYSTGFCRKCALNVSILHAAYKLILIFTAIDCRQDYRVFGASDHASKRRTLSYCLSPTADEIMATELVPTGS